MLTLQQIRNALADRNLKAVADATGLHYNTVRLIARGQIADPGYESVRRLVDYLESPLSK